MAPKKDKAKMLNRVMTAKAFAALVGTSARTITDWMDAGMPVVSRKGVSGASVSIDLRRALKWIVKRRQKEAPARASVANEQAERLRIQNRRSRGELLEANLVEQALAGAGAAVMQDFVALAQRATPDEALQAIILAECRGAQARFAQALGDLAETFRSRAAETGPDGGRVG
jgi:phage terminase Nu1 subunit (DNA packaging protein)